MNLNNRSSGDWDVLAGDTGLLSLNEGSEDQGWDTTLFFGDFVVVVVEEEQIGRVPEYVVIPFHRFLLKVKGDLRIPMQEQLITKIFMALRLVKEEIPISNIQMPIRLHRFIRDLFQIKMSIRLRRWHQKELIVIKIPLRIQGLVQELLSIVIPIKSLKMSKRKLERLRERLRRLDSEEFD